MSVAIWDVQVASKVVVERLARPVEEAVQKYEAIKARPGSLKDRLNSMKHLQSLAQQVR